MTYNIYIPTHTTRSNLFITHLFTLFYSQCYTFTKFSFAPFPNIPAAHTITLLTSYPIHYPLLIILFSSLTTHTSLSLISSCLIPHTLIFIYLIHLYTITIIHITYYIYLYLYTTYLYYYPLIYITYLLPYN